MKSLKYIYKIDWKLFYSALRPFAGDHFVESHIELELALMGKNSIKCIFYFAQNATNQREQPSNDKEIN